VDEGPGSRRWDAHRLGDGLEREVFVVAQIDSRALASGQSSHGGIRRPEALVADDPFRQTRRVVSTIEEIREKREAATSVMVDDDVMRNAEDPGRACAGFRGGGAAHDSTEHFSDEIVDVRRLPHPEADVPADSMGPRFVELGRFARSGTDTPQAAIGERGRRRVADGLRQWLQAWRWLSLR
jgi:hypothetical protein